MKKYLTALTGKMIDGFYRGWFLFKKLSSSPQSLHRIPSPSRIVFIGSILQARIPRTISALKKDHPELRLELWMLKKGVTAEYLSDSGVSVKPFASYWQIAVNMLRDNGNTVYHFFEPKCKPAASIHPHLKHLPMCFDFQDVYVTYYGKNPPLSWMKKDIVFEEYVFNHFDGIIANSLEINEAMRQYRSPKTMRLSFLPYCDESHFSQPVPFSEKTILNVVYAGGISGRSDTNEDSRISDFGALIPVLQQQNIHFHIYPSPNVRKETIREYQEYMRTYPLFTLHDPVNQAGLSKELSRYDFGILPFFHSRDWQGSGKMKYAISLKLFNFLEAGIPILVSQDIEFQHWLCKRYGVGLSLHSEKDLTRIKEIVGAADVSQLQANVRKTRDVLGLRNNIPRLFQFYSNLCALKSS